ncbi:MAG: M14 family metallopeptidase [Cyanobacteria bacterium P01_F01_bin.33]
MLTVYDRIPSGLLALEAPHLHECLSGPTLIHLPGQKPRPLFVSVLLHGNEDTGWLAIREFLRRQGDRPLPRALSILIGNVEAARNRVRRLDTQPDYNRIWQFAGKDTSDSPECRMARQVFDEMAARQVFASIDIHNNTGLNPHYACITRLDPPFLYLATLFGRTAVYFTQPKTVQSAAFAELCPSTVVECGQPGLPHGTQHALDYITACLHLSDFPQHPVRPQDIDLFHTVAIAKVPEDVTFEFHTPDPSFPSPSSDILFPANLDRLNFRELNPNTPFANLSLCEPARLSVVDEDGNDVSDRYFYLKPDGTLVTRQTFMPSMLTLDARIIRQDCLCYLMERYPLPA